MPVRNIVIYGQIVAHFCISRASVTFAGIHRYYILEKMLNLMSLTAITTLELERV